MNFHVDDEMKKAENFRARYMEKSARFLYETRSKKISRRFPRLALFVLP